MDVKKSLITALSLFSIAVMADPAPVADLSRSSNKSFGTATNVRAGSVEERLGALERVVEARASAQLAMQQQLQTLLDEVSELRGTTEMHNYKLEEILQQQRDIYQEIDRRMGGQSSAGPTVQSTAPAVSAHQPNIPAGNPAAVVAADQVGVAEPSTQAAASNNTTADLSELQVYEQALNYVIKDKNYLDTALVALNKIASAGLQSTARRNDLASALKWSRMLEEILKAREKAGYTPSLKLLLTDLMLKV